MNITFTAERNYSLYIIVRKTNLTPLAFTGP